jgi:hypothetical protein
MFKFIFRVMTVTVFLVFLTIGLVIWKGGEPFKVWGRGLCIIGERIAGFGDFVDDLIGDSKKIKKIKEVIESDP